MHLFHHFGRHPKRVAHKCLALLHTRCVSVGSRINTHTRFCVPSSAVSSDSHVTPASAPREPPANHNREHLPEIFTSPWLDTRMLAAFTPLQDE